MVRTIAGTPMVGSPVRMDGERVDSDLPPPALGQHTGEVLQELGVSPAEMERLSREGIVGG
jgi:crotonobetainyl-CoA:carnitine CoA-transferase CaiB-like acyl-CoA transferase